MERRQIEPAPDALLADENTDIVQVPNPAQNAADLTEKEKEKIDEEPKSGGELKNVAAGGAGGASTAKHSVDNIIGEQLNLTISHNIVNSSTRNIDTETTIESLETTLETTDVTKASDSSGLSMVNGIVNESVLNTQMQNPSPNNHTVQRKFGLASPPSKNHRLSIPNNFQTISIPQQRRTSAPPSQILQTQISDSFISSDTVALQSDVNQDKVLSTTVGGGFLEQDDSGGELLKGFVTVHILLDRNKLERVLFSPNQEQKAIIGQWKYLI